MEPARIETYRRNLKALRDFQPAIAPEVDRAPIPEGVEAATGRDGAPTFLIPDENGRATWFGASSMPSVSSAESFAGFVGDGRNVALPGILTGAEPLALATRIAPHCAIFVMEERPLHVKLAFHLYDYVELIATRRIVIVLLDDLPGRLQAVFEDDPGFDLPSELATVAQRSSREIAELQRRLQAAGETAFLIPARQVESAANALHRRVFGPIPPVPRVALLSVDARPAAIEHAERIARALTALHWPYEVCVPDRPDRCHWSARLRAIESIDADLVLLVNGMGMAAETLLPPELPVGCWYFPDAILPNAITMEQPDGAVHFVSSTAQHNALIRAGVPVGSVERCNVGADDVTFFPEPIENKPAKQERPLAAVLADLLDDRPEASDVTQASHLRLWQTLKDLMADRADDYLPGMADDLLEKAQAASGTALKDAKIREHFASLLRSRIAPAIVARSACHALTRSGYQVDVWGANWSMDAPAVATWHGPIPTGAALNRVFNAAGIVVLPSRSPAMEQMALDALAAGACVVSRQAEHGMDADSPGLASFVPYIHRYHANRELSEIATKLEATDATERAGREGARAMVLAEHTVSKRLLMIAGVLRARQSVDCSMGRA